MSDIVQELTINAKPESVFAAITQPDEITRWWANQVTAEPTVGSLAEFRFDNGEIMTMKITDLDPGRKLSWMVRSAPQYAHLWEGTTISWDLAPASNGTKLIFGHHGFATVDAGYAQTRAGWTYFLGSLTSYLETGKGTPYAR